MDDSLTPAELEAWHAVLTVADTLRSMVAAEVKPVTGLSWADHVVLMQLKVAPGNRIQQQPLADKMQWAKARLSRHLTRMQERGLVDRVRDGATPGVLITLTEKGRDAVEAATAPHAEAVRRNLLELATAEELAAFVDFARRLERFAKQSDGA
ncbi:MarR family winged helix-turn-helix transcriptional regulator [Streptomyces olivoreticuli]